MNYTSYTRYTTRLLGAWTWTWTWTKPGPGQVALYRPFGSAPKWPSAVTAQSLLGFISIISIYLRSDVFKK